jgi:hypothetical protein
MLHLEEAISDASGKLMNYSELIKQRLLQETAIVLIRTLAVTF